MQAAIKTAEINPLHQLDASTAQSSLGEFSRPGTG
jgi:hypothetical protein